MNREFRTTTGQHIGATGCEFLVSLRLIFLWTAAKLWAVYTLQFATAEPAVTRWEGKFSVCNFNSQDQSENLQHNRKKSTLNIRRQHLMFGWLINSNSYRFWALNIGRLTVSARERLWSQMIWFVGQELYDNLRAKSTSAVDTLPNKSHWCQMKKQNRKQVAALPTLITKTVLRTTGNISGGNSTHSSHLATHWAAVKPQPQTRHTHTHSSCLLTKRTAISLHLSYSV